MHQRIAKPLLYLICVATLLLHGCTTTGGFISTANFASLDFKPDTICDSSDPAINQGCTPERKKSLAFAPLFNNPATPQDYTVDTVFLELGGSGTCDELSVDYGDGTALQTHFNTRLPAQLTHTFAGWPGTKIARITAIRNCSGSRTAEVLVGYKPNGRSIYKLRYYPALSVCNPVPGVPPVRVGSTLRISTDGTKIKYGIPVFDASGEPGTSAPPAFAFPRLRNYSLVYVIGTQAQQGEAGPVIFRANQTGPLQICVNDNPGDLGDNSSVGMLIEIAINEGSATGP